MTKIIYLDNNATTKVDEKVLEKIIPYFSVDYANPSGMCEFNGRVSRDIQEAREKIRTLVNAKHSKEIIFTGCGTESANTAIIGILKADKTKKHIVTTKVEHPCVLNSYKILEKRGYNVTYLNVDRNGNLDIEELKESIKEDTALVSVMMANNETGVIFPVEEIAEIVKKKNRETKVFVDAVQAAGKIKIDVADTEIDLLSLSAHKFHAPKGVGALYVKTGTLLKAMMVGGHQERGFRAGTENVTGIIGAGEAAQLALDNLQDELTRVKILRDKLENGILSTVYNAKLTTSNVNRVPNTTNIGFEYIEGELILLNLSDLGICASSGSACTSGSLEPSHVLSAMKVPFTQLHGSIRFSLSRFTTEEEIDYTLKVLPSLIEKLNGISPYQNELAELKRKHLGA